MTGAEIRLHKRKETKTAQEMHKVRLRETPKTPDKLAAAADVMLKSPVGPNHILKKTAPHSATITE